MKLQRVNRNNKCPMCGKSDWCGVAPDGSFAVCMRVASDKTTRQGGFIHSFDSKFQIPNSRFEVKSQKSKVKNLPELHQIYSEFLNYLVLSHPHRELLKRRGLDHQSMSLHGYRSMPPKDYCEQIVKELSKNFDLRGVPGFYFQNGNWQFVDYGHATGYLIPIRNYKHEIVGLQLRRDDDRQPKYLMISSASRPSGTNSGTPPHFATFGQTHKNASAESIIITEGVLKANIINELAKGERVVGLISVGAFNESLPGQLREAFPKLEFVKIAFDSDWSTNRAVAVQLERLKNLLYSAGIKPVFLTWNRIYKGLDDYLLSRV